jgi:dTDP-4-amino-4,6-dideoxygalactose transaminase
MAAYYIFKALDLPPASEVVFPALTFWVVPEMARVAGLKPVFADVDPGTFNLDPSALERAITPRTRAVVPTHVYGLPCDMDPIVAIARKHGLRVVEDCAHALGASYRGRPVGTFGDAALFSFQVLKPLNTFGGGAAFTRDAALAERLAALAMAEPWPSEARVLKRIRLGKVERFLMRPAVFSLTLFPILWTASWFEARPDVYLWEKVRPLDPAPPGYHERYGNVQATIGLAALDLLDSWTETTRAHTRTMSQALADIPGVSVPPDPSDRVHVYYQYCVYAPDRDALVRGCLRRGLDIEYHHMDVCSDLPLFRDSRTEARGARRTADAAQLPIHAGLDERTLAVVARRVRAALAVAAPHAGATATVPRR